MTIVYEVKDGLYVNLTNKCPCACEFCIRNNGVGAYGSDPLWLEREPTADETFAAIEASDIAKFSELVFCGYGEPTERIDALLDVARKVKAAHPSLKVRLNTNGLSDLINGRATAREFAGCLDAVSISLNAPTAEEYVALCHPKFGLEAWPAILKFTREICAFVPSVAMTAVATESFSAEKREACEKICREIGVPLRVREFIS